MDQPRQCVTKPGLRIAHLAAQPQSLSLLDEPCHEPAAVESQLQASSSLDQRVLHVLWIIQISCCDQDLKFADIATRLGISCSRLQHLLQRDTGASFGCHLNTQRATQAAVLLRSTSLLVKEIAAKAGFRNILSLERRFKTFFGCTPTEYRNRTSGQKAAAGLL
jgi:AraC-like DNA-binding protein